MPHEEEYLKVLTTNGNPTEEVVLRAEIYEKLLPHYIIHVLLVDSKGNHVFQKRSAKKSYMPNKLVSAGSGHVKADESLVESAIRELAEEAGNELAEELTERAESIDVQVIKYKDPERSDFIKFLGVLKLESDTAPTVQDEDDVQSFITLSPKELAEINMDIEFHPETAFILRKLFLEI